MEVPKELMTEDGKIGTLADALRERIKRGDFGTSGRLPSVVQLSKEYNAARATVYQALQLLQSDGLLIARDNSFYVQYPTMRVSGAPLFDKYLIKQGLTPVTENIVEPEIIPLPPEIAVMFGQQEGVHWVHRMRKHGTADIPYRLAENWYPVDLAGKYVEAMKQDPDLNVAGEIRKETGIAIATRHDDIIARLPTANEAKLLKIVRTAPVIEVRRQFLAKDKRIIFVSNQTLVGAYFMLSYDEEHRRKEEGQPIPQ
jgi:DNA-binding GntR family transcriptional regulator